MHREASHELDMMGLVIKEIHLLSDYMILGVVEALSAVASDEDERFASSSLRVVLPGCFDLLWRHQAREF